MTSLHRLQKDWEGFAQVDPFWAICVDAGKRGNQWTKEELFETGRREIDGVMRYLRSVRLFPSADLPSLDFGCGVGRLTRALALHFCESWGVDISPTMVRLAQEFNQDRSNCRFQLNERDDLRHLPDGKFGFIYSSIVLQHIQRPYVERYLRELIRVLTPGGVFVFQVPEREISPWISKLRNRIGFRSKITRLRGRRTLDAFYMAMHCIAEREVRELLSDQPVDIVDVRLTNSSSAGFNGNLEFLDQEPTEGFVSKQYCLVKIASMRSSTSGDAKGTR
jgi:ubiquinone/menaquinone biosynthesis C-methylase UbiE